MRPVWWWRLALALALFAVLQAVLAHFDYGPRPLRLGLVVALGVVVAGLVHDTLGDPGQLWTLSSVWPITPAGSDARLAGYVRLLEGHLTARTPDAGLRDRLAALCDERLDRRRGLRRTDPEAAALLGPDLVRDLSGPPRRLSPQTIDDHLRRIEEL
jgi:hypothetical protein